MKAKTVKEEAKVKFSFKTVKETGRYASFNPDHHYIKLKGKEVGSIEDKIPYKIHLMVEKEDPMEDGNPNCSWKRIALKKESETLEEAKDFLNNFANEIISKYKLHLLED